MELYGPWLPTRAEGGGPEPLFAKGLDYLVSLICVFGSSPPTSSRLAWKTSAKISALYFVLRGLWNRCNIHFREASSERKGDDI